MATEVKRRRGTTEQHFGGGVYSGFTGATAELTVDTDKWTVHVHDNSTLGGYPLLRADFSNVPTTAPFTNISLDTAIFDTGYSADGNEAQGTLYWNTDELTLSLVTNGETIELGQKVEVNVKNQTGSQINKGEVVYASGTLGASGRILVNKMKADGSIAAKRVLGVAAENIADGADGKVIQFGKLRKIDTTAFSNGDILWVSTSTAGAFQNTEPVQANGEIALPIAFVVYSSGASNGEIFVRVTPIDENEYQNYDAGLQDIAGLTPTDSNIIVGDGTNWVAESGDTARTSLGLGTGDSPTFDGLTSTGVIITDEIDTTSIVWNTSTQQWDATPSEYFNNPVFIGTSLDVDNALLVDDFVEVGTDLDVGGNTTLGGTLNVSGNATLGGTADISSNTTIGGTLAVSGNSTLSGSLTLSGSADFNSTMNLQGNLTTQANLADDGFSEGWAGTNWKINADGSAEFEEMRIRGALRVYEFIAKQISTIGGSEILSIAQGRVSSVNVGADTITVENVTGTAGNAFKTNDLWICQVVDINNDLESGGTGSIVKSVRGTVTSVSGNDIVVTIDAGDITQLEQGDLIIAYGNVSDADRQAIMYRNVDRSEDNLIMRLQTEVNSFADLQAVTNTRVAFGDLNGYSGLSSETFGFFAGDNSGGHILATSSGLFLKDGSTTLAELTSNTFKVGDGTNFLSFDGTDLDIQTDTFTLETTNLSIDSSNEVITLGSADSVTLGKKLNLSASDDSGFRDTLNKYASTVDFYGLYLNPENYFGFVEDDDGNIADGYNFRVGGATSNYIEVNGASGDVAINFDTFTLDATDATGGIKIVSSNELIQLEDANHVRTQIDVTSGSPSISVSTLASIGSTIIDTTTPYETTSGTYYSVNKGNAVEVFIEAELTNLVNCTGGKFTIEIYGGNSTTSATNLLTSKVSPIVTGTGNFTSLYATAYTYDYAYYKIKVTSAIDTPTGGPPNDAEFTTATFTVKEYESQTRIALDGIFVNNDSQQYARLTRDRNTLGGVTVLANLPTSDPNITGALYRDGTTIKISI